MPTQKKEELERELLLLQGKKENRFLRVQRLYDLIGNLDDPRTREHFETKRVSLSQTVSEFENILDRINTVNLTLNEDYIVDYQALDAVESMVCAIRRAASDLDANPSKPVTDSVPLAQLPKIELPCFSGDPLQWPVFYDTFVSLIHSNRRLEDIAKMYYLMGALKGRALDVCAGMQPTAANYPLIWETLVRRFQNPRLLADRHFQRLLDFRPLNVESAEGLTSLAETFTTSYQALRRLPLNDLADFMTASLALAKLDPSSRKSFEMSAHSEIPRLDEVIAFVQRQAGALSQLTRINAPKRVVASWQPAPAPHPKLTSKSPHTLVTKETPLAAHSARICPLCRGSHSVYVCELLVKASVDSRWQLVRKHQLCFNCLSDVHTLSSCKSQSSCRVCRKRHHSLLHRDSEEEKSKSSSVSPPALSNAQESESKVQNLVALQLPPKKVSSVVVLPTAVVKVVTPRGEFQVRFLVDSGSQAHLISLRCCRRLGIPLQRGPPELGGIGGLAEPVKGKVNFVFVARCDPKVQFEVDALVLQRITTAMPPLRLCTSAREKFRNLLLADPAFDSPGEIDGVLGAAIFAQILQDSPAIRSAAGPVAIATVLGHIIMGTAAARVSGSSPPSKIRTLCTFEVPNLEQVMRTFLEVEEIHPPDKPPLIDECEESFVKTARRNAEGRYVVSLPFAEFPPNLGDSFTLAKNRLLSLERNLQKSPEVLSKYHEGMNDYIAQGHVSLSATQDSHSGFFIPHFAVFKESSSTPVRIVFDASCKSSNGRSLNDALLTGPKLQSDIQNLLLRFRVHPVAVVADIRQMFRNILVDPRHRPFQRLLWRFQPQDPVQIYELNCVPFGLRCAPFLALRTVKQLAEDEKERFPIAARIANRDMYVDDVVTSVPEEESAEVVPQLLGLFKAGGFSLAKWTTNSPEVAATMPKEDKLEKVKTLDKGDVLMSGVKVLGLNWDAKADKFFFAYNLREGSGTKRQILSTLARIWDPLGFLAPVTLLCKELLKKLWICKCGWDDDPPEEIRRIWTRVFQELPHLTTISFSRYPGITQVSSTLLVGFADSSEVGFGAVVYVVTKNTSGEALPTLLIAKSKIAPMKLCSIPRLELCAAVLLSQLLDVIRSSFPHFASNQIFALSDSRDVLHWLSKPPCHWKTFVAHRVQKIQNSLPADRWFHVPGKENIADVISRGATPLQLLEHTGWIQGPSWLTRSVQEWPIRKVATDSLPALEAKTFVTVATEPEIRQPIQEFIVRCSSWNKLRRVLVYVMRFAKRLPHRKFISASDLDFVELRLVRVVQLEHFPQEFARLAQKKPPSSALRLLNPFLHDGCIRVGGRLENANAPFSQKHPLLLPKGGHFVHLLIDYFHIFYLHAGPNLLLSLLRQKFWICAARNVVRKRVHLCNRCYRLNPQNTPPLMGPLPLSRVSETKPFVVSGVDYAGPFRVTVGRYRGVKTHKAYVCLFVCFATKAVHLELATDLSTGSFLNCFTRFIARRGPVSVMYSDCGTNFVGAKAQLEAHWELLRSESFQVEFGDLLAAHKIEWKFNPPSAPHFGGLWEANVRSMKSHLFRVVGTQILSWEEFSTFLTQIESLLNSRPLCPLSSEPGELEALTPAHFLTLSPLRALPLSDPRDPPLSLNTRRRLLDQMVRDFWKRWRLEYLTSLQPRKRWTDKSNSLTVGSVVIVREDNSPPLHWPLGVIEEIHPGADGVVRVATVRVRKTLLKRPVVKLFPLPSQ